MFIAWFFMVIFILMSGLFTPIESMPIFFQYLSWLNPLRHYVAISRGILLKGVGLEVLWLHALALLAFAILLLIVSTNLFRRQLV